MTNKKISVGLLGYGYAGKTFHAPLIAGTAGLELMTIASSDAGKVHSDWPSVKVVPDPQSLFSDPSIDLIMISTPNDTHFPLAQQALAAGKHVVVDKPFTVTVSQAQQLRQQASEAKLLLSVFHNRRWDADFFTLQTLLQQGTLGEVVYFESHMDRYRPVVRQRWREQAGPGTGLWYDLGPHLLDQAIVLFGLPQTLSLDLGQLRPSSPAADYFHAVLGYTGRRVILHGTVLAAAETARYIVHGMHGSYIKYGMDPQEESLKAGRYAPQPDWGYDRRDGVVTLLHNDVRTETMLPTLRGNYPGYYAAISDAIRGVAENPVPVTEAILVVALIELGLLSYREQKTVSVPEAELY